MEPEPKREDDEREPAAGEAQSLVDRVRATIGGGEDAEGPFDRGNLSAWLGDEPHAPEPAGYSALPPARDRRTSTPAPERTPVLRDRRFLLVAGLAVLLALALIGASALAVVNARRADDWQSRAEQVEIRTKVINDLLVERSHDVNARTRALNASTAKLRATRRALSRSEADVRALVRRQSELANEKAQAEDATR